MSRLGLVRFLREDRISEFLTHRVSREHVADIAKHGFVLAGSCARLPGLDRRIAAAMGIPARIYSEWASSLRACVVGAATGGGTPALPVRLAAGGGP